MFGMDDIVRHRPGRPDRCGEPPALREPPDALVLVAFVAERRPWLTLVLALPHDGGHRSTGS
jgi:hypothetical protein